MAKMMLTVLAAALALVTIGGCSARTIRIGGDCDKCTQAVINITNALTGATQVAQLKAKITDLCSNLPDESVQKVCEQDLDNLVDLGVTAVQAALNDPHSVCLKFNLCDAQICTACKNAINQVDTQIFGPNGYEEQIKQMVDDYICSRVPDFLKKSCDDAVSAFVDAQLSKLKVELSNPLAICQNASLCTQNDFAVRHVTPILHNVEAGYPCAMCEGMGIAIFIALIEGKNESFIEQRLDKICTELPGKLGQLCSQFLNEELDKFIPAVKASNGNVIAACQSIGLCIMAEKAHQKHRDAKKTKHQVVTNTEVLLNKFAPDDMIIGHITARAQAGYPCAMCEGMGIAIFIALLEGKNESFIEQRLDQICTELPGQLGTLCSNFLNEYLDRFIPAVKASNGNVIAACQSIGLCTAAGETGTVATVQDKVDEIAFNQIMDALDNTNVGAPPPPPVIECAMCEGMGVAIYVAILDGKSDTFIEQRLDQICQKIPVADLATICKNFVDQKLEQFIAAIHASNGDMKEACQQIGVCVNTDL